MKPVRTVIASKGSPSTQHVRKVDGRKEGNNGWNFLKGYTSLSCIDLNNNKILIGALSSTLGLKLRFHLIHRIYNIWNNVTSSRNFMLYIQPTELRILRSRTLKGSQLNCPGT